MGITAVLDTNAFVWAIADPDRLAERAHQTIADPTNQLLVSAATAWEIATKVRLGKFPQAEALIDNFDHAMEELRANELPISTRHAAAAGSLEWAHRDPFDRMLAAQTMALGACLVSQDAQLRQLPGLRTIWD